MDEKVINLKSIFAKNRGFVVFLILFFAIRAVLFNVNISEWGDSYRFLRAAESLRSNLSYPTDEKRLPLFSLLIALNPLPVEPLVWAKIIQILLTAGILFLTFRLAEKFFTNQVGRHKGLCLLLLFNPIFLYWSIRVVAGVLLTFLALLAFYIYYSSSKREMLLGVVCGLAAMTRYEGFFLFPAFALGFLLSKKLKPLILHSSFFILTISPWFIRNYLVFGNPFYSTYFSEPSTYTYDLKTVLIFLASLVFLFGFPPAFLFVARGVRHSRYWPLLIFIILELLLILCWPAAVPRLFLPLIPIFMIFLVGGLEAFGRPQGSPLHLFLTAVILTVLYVLSQYFLRLHFLVLSKSGLAFIVGLGFLSALSWLVFDPKRARQLFIALMLASQMISSFVVINNHRLIYSDAQKAAQFASTLDGLVGYSDETGVVEWYLKEKGRKLPDDFSEPAQQWGWLEENKIDYLLSTDEYEQKSRFNVFDSVDYQGRFSLIGSWEVSAADAFDFWLVRRGVFPPREYPVKHSWVYEVLR